MTTAPADLDHALTVEVTPTGLPDQPWLIIASCTCLGFFRRATAASRPVAVFGQQMAADFHTEHVLRCRAGQELPEQRPSWLPEL